MTWYPIAYLPPQLENTSGAPYSGAVLKAYAEGTNTNIPIATDYTGATTASSITLNAAGYPTHGGAVIIPHLQQNYKLALYPTQAAADADSGSVWSVDYVQIAEDTNSAFVEYFDGNGVDNVFTLSEDFGTDEKILMVFADQSLREHVTNGTFDSDTAWTKGAGWTISAGTAVATGAISTALTQNANPAIVVGQSYTVSYGVGVTAGTIYPYIGGTVGIGRSASGTYTETIIAGSTQALTFQGTGFTGIIDGVSVKAVHAPVRQILRPLDEYTLVGNVLTLTTPPPFGTKNIVVFAPSQLLGAANNAAAAAATSETNAANSAAASADASKLTYSAVATQNYTLVLGDANKLKDMTHASAGAVTIPANASVAFAVGTQIALRQGNTANQITVTPDVGVTLNSKYGRLLTENVQYAMVYLVKIATDTWQVTGDLSA